MSHCGFIEMKLRNLRRALHDDQRRYRKRGRSSDPSRAAVTLETVAVGEDESINEWITVTKRMRPSPENLTSIKMGMEKTFTHRRVWITSKAPTVAEIFQQYPRFVDLSYMVSTYDIVLQMHYVFNMFFIFYHLSGVRLRGQQPKQGNPDSLFLAFELGRVHFYQQ